MKKDTSILPSKPWEISGLSKEKILLEIAISIFSGFLLIKLCFCVCVFMFVKSSPTSVIWLRFLCVCVCFFKF